MREGRRCKATGGELETPPRPPSSPGLPRRHARRVRGKFREILEQRRAKSDPRPPVREEAEQRDVRSRFARLSPHRFQQGSQVEPRLHLIRVRAPADAQPDRGAGTALERRPARLTGLEHRLEILQELDEVEVEDRRLRNAQQRNERVLPGGRTVPVPLDGDLHLQSGGSLHAVGDPARHLQPEAQIRGLVEEHGHAASVTRPSGGRSTPVVCRTALRMRRLRSLALPTLSGVLYFLSWIGFGIWPLAFVCFVPLVFALRDATPAEALRRGAWFGFIAHLGGYTWVIHLLRLFAFAPLPLAFLGYVLLCLVQGLLFGVFAWALRRAWTATRWPLALLLPVSLVATEFVYPLLFQSYTGVALMPLIPLVQIADLGGVLLLSALQGAINGALAGVLLTRRPWPVVGTALVVVVAMLYGLWRMAWVGAREQ